MSVKVPKETVEYQSHNHCQCDFCTSRRSVNAKKLSVSQRAAQLQHAQQQSGCCCRCHDAVNASTFAASRGANSNFDPQYPAPVNQTALNASRGRNGTPNHGQSSTAVAGQSAIGGGATRRTKEEEEKSAMDELDQLERLLILEHKARVKAALEADRVGMLRSAKTDGMSASAGPQPLPAGYTFTSSGSQRSQQQEQQQQTFNGSGSNYRSGYDMLDGVSGETIREAYELAHQCPVPPPVQCRASHRLQDTMDGLRAVTMDPVNPAGRDAIQQVLYVNGMAPTPDAGASAANQQQQQRGGTWVTTTTTTTTTEEKQFGNSLAKNRTSHPHPHGAGLVWVNGQRTVVAADGLSMPATQYQQQQRADGTRVATKTVTYAV